MMSIGFLLIILVGTVLLTLPAASKLDPVPITDALFTATSATCVTGLIIADTFTQWSLFGQVVIIVLVQIGGLGIMTFATLISIILRKRIGLTERLLISESLSTGLVSGVVRLAIKVFIFSVIIESTGAVILSIRFVRDFGIDQGIYRGIFYSISSFCNAGFDLMGSDKAFSSLTNYSGDITVNTTVMALTLIGGLGFIVLSDIFHNRTDVKKYSIHTKIVLIVTAIIIVSATVIYFIFEFNNAATIKNMPIKSKVLVSMFQSVTSRTAGFSTVNISAMKDSSIIILLFLMFIGASPGSTGGGIKTTTFATIILTVVSLLRGKEDVTVFGKRLHRAAVSRAISVLFIAGISIIFVSATICFIEGLPVKEVLFEVVSAFSTVGLSFGITPDLHGISKILLIFMMYFGRVGVLTLTFAISSKLQKHTSYRLPEENIMIG